MKILSLSTAEQGCSLAVLDAGHLVCEEYWDSRLTHAKRLVGMLAHLLQNRAGLRLEEVDGFLAARGPGSFTGLRIGISVVQGLAYALAKPVAGVSSLDGIAWRFSHSTMPVVAMMDAKRGEVYCAVYRFERGGLAGRSDETVCSPEQAIDMAGKGDVLFAGSGSKAYGALIRSRSGAVLAPDFMDYVSAAAMGRQVTEDFFQNPGNRLLPVYLRKSDAEIAFGRKREKGERKKGNNDLPSPFSLFSLDTKRQS